MGKREHKPEPELPPKAIGAPEIRVQRGEVVVETRNVEDANGRVVGSTRGHGVGSLRRYRARREITEFEFEAGRHVAEDWFIWSNVLGVRAVDYMREVRGQGGSDALANAVWASKQAQERFTSVMRALPQELHSVVRIVCCEDKPASEWAKAVGWRDDAGLPVLRIALQIVGRHLQIPRN